VTNTLVLLRPIVTEKSMTQTNDGKYTFEVRTSATKQEIAEAVAEAFKVDVVEVNVMNVKGKSRRYGRRIGRKPDRKKAVVTVAKGQRIERYFVEGGV
jgi:large subunit ribosomal protein L23